MFLMYVDESGDPGMQNSPTRYFVLSAVVFHELRWRKILTDLVVFRRKLRDTKELKIREEIHAQHFINSPGELVRIKRHNRLDILKKCLDWLAQDSDISVFSVVVDKSNKSPEVDIYDIAWKTLLQRFNNTIQHKNFAGPANPDERGALLPDNTDGKKLTMLLRKMRVYNPIPSKLAGYMDKPIEYIIEDSILRHSYNSLLIQMVDVVAYFAQQLFDSNAYIKRKGAHNFYQRLAPVLNKYVSSTGNGIVLV